MKVTLDVRFPPRDSYLRNAELEIESCSKAYVDMTFKGTGFRVDIDELIRVLSMFQSKGK